MPRDPRAVKVLPVAHPHGCRSYLIVDPTTREACVVDPLLDRAAEIARLLDGERATLRWIVDTHAHGDHLSGARALQARSGGEVVAHPASASAFATRRVLDGERLPIGEQALVVHHAPGLTPDALVVVAPGAVFPGDTLLIGTVGVRDAPGSDPARWHASLHRILDPLPDDVVLHPGHDDMGRAETTLGRQRGGNPWLRAQDLEEFRVHYDADDRPACRDAPVLLEKNAEGLLRVPSDLEASGGLLDPARQREREARAEAPWTPGAPPPDPAPGTARTVLLLGGAAAVIGTLLGWGVHPLFHALAGLAGLAGLGLALSGPRSRRPAAPRVGLYYEGAPRRVIGS